MTMMVNKIDSRTLTGRNLQVFGFRKLQLPLQITTSNDPSVREAMYSSEPEVNICKKAISDEHKSLRNMGAWSNIKRSSIMTSVHGKQLAWYERSRAMVMVYPPNLRLE